jgi:hypothetical protein
MRYRLRLWVFSFVLLVILAGVGKKYFFDNSQKSFAVQENPVGEETSKLPLQDNQEGKKNNINEPLENIREDSQATWASMMKDRKEYLDDDDSQDATLKKYLFAQYLYTQHNNEKALPIAISLAIQLGKFDEANELIADLPESGDLKNIVSFDVLMKLLFNTSDLSFARLKQIKTIIENAYASKKIDLATYNWYFFIMTVIKWDLENAHFYLDGLQFTNQKTKRDQLLILQKATEAYWSTPIYHLRAVRAMYLYQQWWWWPALHIGQEIRQQDPNYLLAEQLIAYWSMALQDRKQAIYALQHLQKTDVTYTDMYQFFQWIAHYFLNEHQESILLLKQVSSKSAYAPDINRYLLLNYVALGERKQVTEIVKQFVDQKKIVVTDFATLFDLLLFYKSDGEEKLSNSDQEMIQKLIERCQHELKDDLHVCLYGKWWLLFRQWEEQKAYMILHRIVEWYPKKRIYELLITYAEKEWNDDANKRKEQLFLIENNQKTDFVPEVDLQ